MEIKELLLKLQQALDSAVKDLPKVTAKKMFGCHAVWINDQVFGLVWKHGRIGFRLPESDSFEALMGLKGADPWTAGNRTMSHWVLVPADFHTRQSELKKWAKKSYEIANMGKQSPKKPAKPKATTNKKAK